MSIIETEREKIKTQITRFKSWEDIFRNPDDRDRHFEDFVDSIRNEYKKNNTLRREEVMPVSEDDETTTIVLTRTMTGRKTGISRLQNGNVVVKFIGLDSQNVEEIKPEVGNRNHNWKHDQVQSMRKRLIEMARKCKVIEEKYILETTAFYLKGKPASQNWEDTFIYNMFVPQRIGYKIYPEQLLRKAKDLIRK